MKKLVAAALLFCAVFSLSGCANTQESDTDTAASAVSEATDAVESKGAPSDSDGEEVSSVYPVQDEDAEEEALRMKVQIGDSVFAATLEENEAVNALVEMMKDSPVVIKMSDYSSFEKVGPLGTSLPTSESQTTTQAGDIVLYNGNQIVMFYGSNSWSYTRLGHIDNLTGWEEALGGGDVTVIFSLE